MISQKTAWSQWLFAFLLMVMACFFISCKVKPKSPVVARVGSSELTLDDLYKTIPPEYSDFITREQIVNYVKRWMDNQILYHEALRLKIDKEEIMRGRLKRMKEDLLCAEMISRNSVPAPDNKVPEDRVAKYYAENKGKFIREKNVAQFMEIVCDDAASAWKVRSLVTLDNFVYLASQYSKVPLPDAKNISYVKLDDLPANLSQEIAATKANGTTNVIQIGATYCIVRVLDKQPKGTLCRLDEVHDEIVNILASTMQNAALEQLIATLRSKMIVETHLDVITDHQSASIDSSAVKRDSLPHDSLAVQQQE